MTSTISADVRLLAQADLLFLLAGWLRGSRDDQAPENQPTARDLRELEETCGLQSGAIPLADLEAQRLRISKDSWRAEHGRLFEGAIACPPNETAYVRRDKGAILADLAGFHRAFGFDHAECVGEKRDHVISELQFVGLLLVMLARARSNDLREEEDITYHALSAFAADHIGVWIDPFCERLMAAAKLPFLVDLGSLLKSAWRGICADHGLPLPEPGRVPSDLSSSSPYECDGCPRS